MDHKSRTYYLNVGCVTIWFKEIFLFFTQWNFLGTLIRNFGQLITQYLKINHRSSKNFAKEANYQNSSF